MSEQYNNDEINLKELAKRVIKIARSRKKIFTSLLIGIMLLSTAYFIKVMLKPSYKSELILKTKAIRKDQLNTIIDKYNLAIKEEDPTISKEVLTVFKNDFISKIELVEIKADITSPDKNDATKYFRIITFYSQKPDKSIESNINVILKDINEISSKDNDIIIGKIKTLAAISDLDSLLKVAMPSGANYRDKISSSSNMLVLNDLYKSLNDLLSRKSSLTTELMYYQTENLIFKASPVVFSKKISMPIAIFFIGFLVWFFLSTFMVIGIMIFGDES